MSIGKIVNWQKVNWQNDQLTKWSTGKLPTSKLSTGKVDNWEMVNWQYGHMSTLLQGKVSHGNFFIVKLSPGKLSLETINTWQLATGKVPNIKIGTLNPIKHIYVD